MITYVVRWLNKIFITKWIKAPFLVHKFFMMHLLILEGAGALKNNLCTYGKTKWLPL